MELMGTMAAMINKIFIVILILIIPVISFATTRYVCISATTCDTGALGNTDWETGTDSGDATSRGTPWKTLAYALGASSALSAGDTLIVGKGTYSESVIVYKSGTEGSEITIQSESPWEGHIDGSGNAAALILQNSGVRSYLIFEDLDIEGGTHVINLNGDDQAMHDISFTNCKIHDNDDAVYYSSCIAAGGGYLHSIFIDRTEFYNCGTGETAWTDCNNGLDGCQVGADSPLGYAIYMAGANWQITNSIFHSPASYAGPHIKIDGHDSSVDSYTPSVLIENCTFADFSTNPPSGKLDFQVYITGVGNSSQGKATATKKITIANSNFYNPGGDNPSTWNNCDYTALCINNVNDTYDNGLNFYSNRSDMELFGYYCYPSTPCGGVPVPDTESDTQDEDQGWAVADFAFSDASNDDYSLTSSSLCIDQGNPTYAPSVDFLNISRPQGSTDDIGAFEFQSGPIRTAPYPTSQQACGSDPQTVEMGLTTAANADCKYDTDGNEAYADMANTFSTTGTTSHSQDVSQVCDGSTVYYVRCTDGTYTNLTDLEITVDVASEPPPPSAGINMIVGGNQTVEQGGGLTINCP